MSMMDNLIYIVVAALLASLFMATIIFHVSPLFVVFKACSLCFRGCLWSILLLFQVVLLSSWVLQTLAIGFYYYPEAEQQTFAYFQFQKEVKANGFAFAFIKHMFLGYMFVKYVQFLALRNHGHDLLVMEQQSLRTLYQEDDDYDVVTQRKRNSLPDGKRAFYLRHVQECRRRRRVIRRLQNVIECSILTHFLWFWCRLVEGDDSQIKKHLSSFGKIKNPAKLYSLMSEEAKDFFDLHVKQGIYSDLCLYESYNRLRFGHLMKDLGVSDLLSVQIQEKRRRFSSPIIKFFCPFTLRRSQIIEHFVYFRSSKMNELTKKFYDKISKTKLKELGD